MKEENAHNAERVRDPCIVLDRKLKFNQLIEQVGTDMFLFGREGGMDGGANGKMPTKNRKKLQALTGRPAAVLNKILKS